MKIKKLVIVFLAFFSCFIFALSVQAQEARELELDYPLIQGSQPETINIPITEYVRYIFNFAVWVAGILALLVLIYAGIQYFLSTGNPEKIKDAKDSITSALIGLLILLGSYLILWSINPNLVTFELQRLKPIISELSPGVFVCKKEVPISEAWALSNNYRWAETYLEQSIIADRLEVLFENIQKNCYMVLTRGNIRSDFDDQVRDIYFIPGDQTIDGQRYIAIYGAVIYEDRGYEGKSDIFFEHFLGALGVVIPKHISVSPDFINTSSIELFLLIPQQPGSLNAVTLYQKPSQNQGFEGEPEFSEASYIMPPGIWFGDFDIRGTWGGEGLAFWRDEDGDEETEYHAPESIKSRSNFIAVLNTEDLRNDIFFEEIDNNLLDNINIVDWEDCQELICSGGSAMGGGGCVWRWTKCAVAAATRLFIISAEVY